MSQKFGMSSHTLKKPTTNRKPHQTNKKQQQQNTSNKKQEGKQKCKQQHKNYINNTNLSLLYFIMGPKNLLFYIHKMELKIKSLPLNCDSTAFNFFFFTDLSVNPNFQGTDQKGVPLVIVLGYNNGVQIWHITVSVFFTFSCFSLLCQNVLERRKERRKCFI